MILLVGTGKGYYKKRSLVKVAGLFPAAAAEFARAHPYAVPRFKLRLWFTRSYTTSSSAACIPVRNVTARAMLVRARGACAAFGGAPTVTEHPSPYLSIADRLACSATPVPRA